MRRFYVLFCIVLITLIAHGCRQDEKIDDETVDITLDEVIVALTAYFTDYNDRTMDNVTFFNTYSGLVSTDLDDYRARRSFILSQNLILDIDESSISYSETKKDATPDDATDETDSPPKKPDPWGDFMRDWWRHRRESFDPDELDIWANVTMRYRTVFPTEGFDPAGSNIDDYVLREVTTAAIVWKSESDDIGVHVHIMPEPVMNSTLTPRTWLGEIETLNVLETFFANLIDSEFSDIALSTLYFLGMPTHYFSARRDALIEEGHDIEILSIHDAFPEHSETPFQVTIRYFDPEDDWEEPDSFLLLIEHYPEGHYYFHMHCGFPGESPHHGDPEGHLHGFFDDFNDGDMPCRAFADEHLKWTERGDGEWACRVFRENGLQLTYLHAILHEWEEGPVVIEPELIIGILFDDDGLMCCTPFGYFSEDDDGLHISFYPPVFWSSLIEWIEVWQYVDAMTDAFNDPNLVDVDFCDLYGFLIPDCMELRDTGGQATIIGLHRLDTVHDPRYECIWELEFIPVPYPLKAFYWHGEEPVPVD